MREGGVLHFCFLSFVGHPCSNHVLYSYFLFHLPPLFHCSKAPESVCASRAFCEGDHKEVTANPECVHVLLDRKGAHSRSLKTYHPVLQSHCVLMHAFGTVAVREREKV